jgi:hypothetical protein
MNFGHCQLYPTTIVTAMTVHVPAFCPGLLMVEWQKQLFFVLYWCQSMECVAFVHLLPGVRDGGIGGNPGERRAAGRRG